MKGFAVTLVIGLIANVFTAVFVSERFSIGSSGRQKHAVALSI